MKKSEVCITKSILGFTLVPDDGETDRYCRCGAGV